MSSGEGQPFVRPGSSTLLFHWDLDLWSLAFHLYQKLSWFLCRRKVLILSFLPQNHHPVLCLPSHSLCTEGDGTLLYLGD